MAKCLRCGAGDEWIQGRVPDEVVNPTDWQCPKCDSYSPGPERKCWNCSYDRTSNPKGPQE